MNFYDLSAKLRAIEENAPVAEKPFVGNHTLVAPRPDGKFDVMDSASGNAHIVGTYDTLAQANEAAKSNDEISTKVVATMKEQVSNECGDMMPMPMMSHASQQQDSVTMNVSMNGSGPGGIKDLMAILRNIEQSAEHDHAEPMIAQPHGMDGDVDIVLGTADEDMLSNADADESYGNSAPGGSDAHTYGIDSVTRKGDDMHSKGDVKRLRVNGGENPLQEGLVERLSAMYQAIKETDEPLTRRVTMNPDGSTSGGLQVTPADPNRPVDPRKQAMRQAQDQSEQAYNAWLKTRPARADGSLMQANLKKDDVARVLAGEDPNSVITGRSSTGAFGSDPAQYRALAQQYLAWLAKMPPKFNPLDEAAKRTMSRAAKGYMKYGKKGMKALADAGREGKDLEPIQDKFNKYKEGYNPNSVDAEHRRSLEKSHEDSLKKKADDGDESAKKRLQALKDKKERMRNDYNDRMER